MREYIIIFLLVIALLTGSLLLGLKTYENYIIQYRAGDEYDRTTRALYHHYITYIFATKPDSPQPLNWSDELSLDSDYDNYAINRNIENYTFENLPGTIVLFFKSGLGRNGVGGINDVKYDHEGMARITFVNGRVALVAKEDINKLRWE